MELMMVIALIVILLTLGLTNWKRQIGKSLDTRKKQDLQNLKIALEQYYSDNDCYPQLAMMATCGGTALAPYIQAIPCDPDGQKPYVYLAQDPASLCRGYRILTKLNDTSDTDITRVGCDPVTGCGDGQFNYGVSSGGPVSL